MPRRVQTRQRAALRPEDQLVEQKRVVFDRTPPRIQSVRPVTANDGSPGIEWEVTDDNLDPRGIRLEFRWDGQGRYEPIDRNVFGLLDEFGDAEIASLITPRALLVEACAVPDVTLPPGTNGAPGRLTTPPVDRVRGEVDRLRELVPQHVFCPLGDRLAVDQMLGPDVLGDGVATP